MLLNAIEALGSTTQTFWGAEQSVLLGDILTSTSLSHPRRDCLGRSVVILVEDQLASAMALIELDGTARRMVVCPQGLNERHLRTVVEDAEADTIVVGPGQQIFDSLQSLFVIRCELPLARREQAHTKAFDTEWALLTSGTSGPPKVVCHSVDGLCGAFEGGARRTPNATWATFYDIRRYGGLQILLRAILGGNSLVVSQANEATANHLRRLASRGATHISGTPSHWRKVVINPKALDFRPDYVRLSGEIADQPLLDTLSAVFSPAEIVHAYASTEAGVAIEVGDGRAGIPLDAVGAYGAVELRVEDGELLIRSDRAATRYLGSSAPSLRDPDGFVHTRDMVERRGDRWCFVGRRDGVINVGGLKVHPEEVEALINQHEMVRASFVKGRQNPITGMIVVAEVVLKQDGDEITGERASRVKDEIFALCRSALPSHKLPATIRVVDQLEMSTGGKLARRNA